MCPHSKGCPLFKELRGTLKVWRQIYCDEDERYPTCARFRVSNEGRTVPLTLLPNGKDIGVSAGN